MLHQLDKVIIRSKKRVGRGIGSGKGKTATRGTKGQKARGSVPLGFWGSSLPLYKQLPYRRGLGNPVKSRSALPIKLDKLAVFKTGAVVDLESLIRENLIKGRDLRKGGIKIVGSFDLGKKLTVKVPASASARASIEASGGRVE